MYRKLEGQYIIRASVFASRTPSSKPQTMSRGAVEAPAPTRDGFRWVSAVGLILCLAVIGEAAAAAVVVVVVVVVVVLGPRNPPPRLPWVSMRAPPPGPRWLDALLPAVDAVVDAAAPGRRRQMPGARV